MPDGAADEPLSSLEGRTPLEAAEIPNMDAIARDGATGLSYTVPKGMPPGSDVANLSVMGYDPAIHYGGRGPVEAANLGIEIPEGWTCFRCNLVSTDGSDMVDYSAGHILQEDTHRIMNALEERLGSDDVRFFEGKSYRNLLLLRGDFTGVECVPPHDITGQGMREHLPRNEGAEVLLKLMRDSWDVMDGMQDGSAAADMIWPWGQGTRMALPLFGEVYGLSGGVISAVDLVCGLGRCAGLDCIPVEGITGYFDTDYAAKGRAAIGALQTGDFVYVHVEAPDEASHVGNLHEKIRALENIDEHIVGPVLEHLKRSGNEYRVLVSPDHPTFIRTMTHDGSPVPYAACGTGISRSGAPSYCEKVAPLYGPDFDPGWKIVPALMGKWPSE